MFSDNLRNLLYEKNINANQLAKMCGMSKSAFYRYLTGERKPSAETIERIATALSVPEGRLRTEHAKITAADFMYYYDNLTYSEREMVAELMKSLIKAREEKCNGYYKG